MLTICPECELQVSDKAVTCPHCGYPLIENKPIKTEKKQGHLKLPNGFGQISKCNNPNLRNPYRAMVTVGKNSFGKPICKILKPQGYFKTYNEAYAALIEYNKNPYDLDDDVTVSELYNKWSSEYFKTLKSSSSIRTVTCAWSYCSTIYNMRAKDIRARHIKNIMEEGYVVRDGKKIYATPNIKSRIKSVFNLMLDYGVEYEIVDRNYARTFEISKDVIKERDKAKRQHLSFTEEELSTLWANKDVPWVNIILIQCYSGWRPQELGLIRTENVDLKSGFIIGGMKTESGTDRPVPIHPAILPLIEDLYDPDQKYLIDCNGLLTYDKYRHRFEAVVNQLGLNAEHRAHDGRKTFITLAKKYGMDEYAIKYIAGHKINDITEAIYTDRDISWLSSEIKKIKVDVFSA